MPSLILPIEPEGALVEVEIGWAVARARALRSAGQPVPPPVQVRALIDTGAEISCLDSAYVRQLALYRAVLQKLYPDRPVRAVLVWTDIPDLMELPPEALDTAIAQRFYQPESGAHRDLTAPVAPAPAD